MHKLKKGSKLLILLTLPAMILPVTLPSVLFPSVALAQFQASEAKVFVDWPDLQVGREPGSQSEAKVYAVIDHPIALYTILENNRYGPALLGTFQCNREFTVLKSTSNGYFDILCVDENIFEEKTSSVLRFGANGTYGN